MIKSMTGYGRARQILNQRDITIEIRSVNNRYLDCAVKIPRIYIFAEDMLKRRVQEVVSRGKVDIFVTVDSSVMNTVQISVNRELAALYAAALREVAEVIEIEPTITAREIAQFPDVLTVTKADEDLEALNDDLCKILDEALESYQAMRITEGEKLATDITNRLNMIAHYTEEIEKRSPETVTEYRERLTSRMQEILQSTTIDEQRILLEAAIYADKVAVDEETVRLKSHISQLRSLLSSNTPVGRKIDFLIQEINREANTIGSKCNDINIAQIVINIKAEVEKIREQAQNVE